MSVSMGFSASPLVEHVASGSPLAWWRDRFIERETYLNHVARLASRLPQRAYAINLCEDRYLFMVAFVAVVARGQTNLLPPNQVGQDVQCIAADFPSSYCLRDSDVERWLVDGKPVDALRPVPAAPPDHQAAIVFTSGSTGRPRPNIKYWGDLVAGTRLAQRRFGFGADRPVSLVATVPPQHMYGLETSVLVPLLGQASVHGGKPFFPEDIREALTAMPAPRVLVTTPVHLRICAASGIRWPALEFIVSATAPLSGSLAGRSEQAFDAPVLEIYGCSEAGSIASRRTLAGDLWRLYDGLRISAETGCVYASHLREPVALHDRIECHGDRHFRLLGRHDDLINIAGKRTSLAELNLKLNEIEGVEDGVFILPEEGEGKVIRLIALVVAPTLSEPEIIAALRERIDPAFLPRPLYKVERLPRNATGKLPRQELLSLLRSAHMAKGEE